MTQSFVGAHTANYSWEPPFERLRVQADTDYKEWQRPYNIARRRTTALTVPDTQRKVQVAQKPNCP